MFDGLHAERTSLAWSRTWLAALLGVALSLRIVAIQGVWWLLVSVVIVVALALATSTVARTSVARGAALVAMVLAIGVLTVASVVVQLMAG